MSPVPKPGRGRPPTKLPYGKATPDHPVVVKTKGESVKDNRRQGKVLRTNVCQWGTRHGVRLVVRLVSHSKDGLSSKYEVHHAGRRK